jgi:hypothetical protein
VEEKPGVGPCSFSSEHLVGRVWRFFFFAFEVFQKYLSTCVLMHMTQVVNIIWMASSCPEVVISSFFVPLALLCSAAEC